MAGNPENDPDAAQSVCEKELLTTGDMARLTRSTLRTVRFYEEEGLLEPTLRNDNGCRMFSKRELLKLQLILDLREAGMSLNDIKTLFQLKACASTPDEARREMVAFLGTQIDELQRKMATLKRLRSEMASMVAVISGCHGCRDVRFPHRCCDCDVLQQPDLPRVVRLLWDT